LVAATKLGAGGAQLTCAKDAFNSLLAIDTSAVDAAEARRFAALVGIVSVHQAEGRPDLAVGEIDRFVARWHSGTSLLVRHARVDSASAERARAIAKSDSALFGADFARSPFATRLWLLGLWSAHEGRLASAAGAARELYRRADSLERHGDSLAARYDRRFA